jgi:hypothetical protein
LRQNACADRSLASNSAKTRSRSFVESMADVSASDASARPHHFVQGVPGR